MIINLKCQIKDLVKIIMVEQIVFHKSEKEKERNELGLYLARKDQRKR